MKFLLVLCLLSLVVLSMADTETNSRGCFYILGQCKEACPEGTHAYTSACRPKLPEPTCDEPNPVAKGGDVCDYSACYCDSPTVRDLKTRKCVPLEECPKEEKNSKEE